MCRSLVTTVATPRKWPGRDDPSRWSLRPATSPKVLAPLGYISSAEGANTRSNFRSSQASGKSCSRFLG